MNQPHQDRTGQLFLSHVVCMVADLDEAVTQARDEGFTTAYGSDPETANNALVWSATGPFVEFAVSRPFDDEALSLLAENVGPQVVNRITYQATLGTGWAHTAAETPAHDLDAVVARLTDAGVGPLKPVRWRRTPPGESDPVSWWLSHPMNPHLPFFMSAYSRPQRPRAISHPNGATELTRVHIATPEPAGYTTELSAFLGTRPDGRWAITSGDQHRITACTFAGLTEHRTIGDAAFLAEGGTRTADGP